MRLISLNLTHVRRCRISQKENENLRNDLKKESRMRAKAKEDLSDLQHRFVVSCLDLSIWPWPTS